MTDTIESLRAERDALKTEVERVRSTINAAAFERAEAISTDDIVLRLTAEAEELEEVNHSVAVCAGHTNDITNGEGLDNGCYRCTVESQDALLERAREIMRPLLHYHERGEHHDRLAKILKDTE